MRLLITGVAGFVGGHLVERLRVSRSSAEFFGLELVHGGAPPEIPPGVTLVGADLNDSASVGAALDATSPDRIIHLAGLSSVRYSWTDPGGTLRTNVLGFVHILEGLLRRGWAPRILAIGSADEYGPVSANDLPLRETNPLRPNSPYAVSKAAQGLLAREYAARIPVVVTRTFPHTGPRRGEAFAESSFARQIAEIEAGRRLPVLEVGNLDAVRDYCDVRDVVRAYDALLEQGVPGEVYNVCSGRGVRIGEVLDILLAYSSVRVEVRVDPKRLRPVDIPNLVGDPSKLRAATGWEPRISLETTLKDLLEDWRGRVRAYVATPHVAK